jgi:hypothetical protein
MTDSWGMLLLLGAFHGINPGMGWLFAVALGMQQNRSAVVWQAILPIGIGHGCAIAAAILLAALAGVVLPVGVLRWSVAVFLVSFGVLRFFRQRHPRWGSMRIGHIGLAFWSFLIASAHGAGLMVLPVWLDLTTANVQAAHSAHVHAAADLTSGLAATAVHSGSYLLVTAAIAWVVFHKLGVGLLRSAWINLDLIWSAALVLSGVLTLVAMPS